MAIIRSFAPLLLLTVLTACGQVSTLTASEEIESYTAAISASQSSQVSDPVIEISTSFTMGQAVRDAAAELRDFVQSQIPCSTVTVQDATVTIDFGTLDDQCTWNDHSWAGVATISITRAEAGQAEVAHTWIGLTNGEHTLDGDATVTWDRVAGSRNVVHDIDWTDEDGQVVHATGDRTMTLIDPELGLEGGIEINGQRDWTNDRGLYDLQIDGIEARGIDPVPQAGTYTLTLPSGRVATLSFARVDEDTIAVTLSGGRRERVWHITSEGSEEQPAS